jgi:hypothetical protein
MATTSGKQRRTGNIYQITPEEIEQYRENGYLVLHDVLTDEEVATLEPWFDHFIEGKEQHLMAKDFYP